MAKRFALFVVWAALACAAAYSQTVSIVSGNGQLVPEYNLASQPLKVLVTGANGAPLANATVNWTITSGLATIQRPITTTDVNGIAETTFLASQVTPGYS